MSVLPTVDDEDEEHPLTSVGPSTPGLERAPRTPRRVLSWPFLVVLTATVTATVVMTVAKPGPWPLLALVAWTGAALSRVVGGRAITLAEQLVGDVKALAVLASTAAFAAVAGLVPLHTSRSCVVVVGAAGASAMALRLLQPRLAKVRSVVLVGGEAEVGAYTASAKLDHEVVGRLVVDAVNGPVEAVLPASSAVPTATRLDSLAQLVTESAADEVLVLPGAAVDSRLVRDLSWMFEDSSVTLGIMHPVSAVSAHRLRTRVGGDSTVIELGIPRATAVGRVVKGLMDRAVAAGLLLVTLPLLVMVWLAVRLDSSGPGFFVQTRVGQDGRPFPMVKFRSMHTNAEELLRELVEDNESDGLLFKIRRDPRVTRIGYWLRRSSLDELPQLLNVVLGQMSLVGPRPALPAEVANYDAVSRRRLVVKPGITGLWQVSGRSDLSWEESILLDLYYADNWRLRDDLSIAARTLSAVVRARGAY